MKRMADVQAADFPDVDPARFDAWKQATIEMQRRSLWVMPLTVVAVAGAYLLVEGFAAAILIIAIVAAGGMLTSASANRAAKEAGITRPMIRQARR